MTQFGNAAQRLFRLLYRSGFVDDKARAESAWQAILDFETDSGAELLSRIAPVFTLPRQVRLEAEQAGLHENYLTKFEEIEAALATKAFQSPWSYFKGAISDEALTSLRICGTRLAEQDHSPDIDTEVLDGLLDQLRVISDEIRKSTVSADLKRFLFEHLGKGERAIQDYAVLGPDGFKEVFQASVGEAVVRTDLQQEQASSAAKKFWDFMQRAALALQVTRTTLELPPAVGDLLKLGP